MRTVKELISIDELNARKYINDADKRNKSDDESYIPTLLRIKNYAKRNYINDLYFQACDRIYYWYAVFLLDGAKAKIIRKEYDRAYEILQAEIKSRAYYMEFAPLMNGSRKLNALYVQRLKKACETVKGYLAYNNPGVGLYAYQLLVNSEIRLGRYDQAMKYFEEGIAAIEQKDKKSSTYIKFLVISYLITRGNYSYASDLLQGMSAFKFNKSNSLIIGVYKVVLLFHQEKYQEAVNLYEQLDAKKGLRGQINEATREQWLIISGYIEVLYLSGIVNTQKRYRVYKTLNDIPLATADKYGNFTNIWILKMLIGLKKNKGKLAQDYEKYEHAYYRYTKTGTRERLFFKMLLTIISKHFNKIAINRHTDADFKKLKNLRLNPENLDVIPFLVLWNIATNDL